MSTMKKMISKTVNKVSAMLDPAGLSQETGTGADAGYSNEGMDNLIRTAGAEGCVLLKNDGALPLKKSDKVAVFGRCQYNYFCVVTAVGEMLTLLTKLILLTECVAAKSAFMKT